MLLQLDKNLEYFALDTEEFGETSTYHQVNAVFSFIHSNARKIKDISLF
jgi:hypothetical protein